MAPPSPTVRLPASRPESAPARLRVLISAYAVSPVRGSEPGIGWNYVSRIPKYHDVTLLCSPNVPGSSQDFRSEIDSYLARNPIDGLTVRYVEPPPLSYWFQRESIVRRRTVYYVGYAAWQRAAHREAMALHAGRAFDVTHHLTITGYREPGYLWKMPVPFVWGPVNGAADVPSAYLPMMGRGDRLFYRFRNLANRVQKHTNRRSRAAAQAARHIFAIDEENRRLVTDRWGKPAEILSETAAAAPAVDAAPKRFDPSGGRPLRLAWSGLHVGRKALPILLHALGKLRQDGVLAELSVLGGGTETGRWRALAEQLGVAASVRWVGQLSQREALAEVARADAFVLTSVQEGTPFVVLEALSLGLPVVCHNACGMGAAVDDTCGIKVPLQNPVTSIDGFARAIRRLATVPGEVERLSEGALVRARQLDWETNARRVADVYRAVVGAGVPAGGAR